MSRRNKRRERDEALPAPIEPSGPRLWMEPWMKWTGMSFWAAVVTWFRVPREERRVTVFAALVAVGIFAVVFGIGAGLVWLLGRV